MVLDSKIKAVIFDMDGVISDTQSLMSRVESEFLREHDVNLSPEEITKRYAGTTSGEMLTNAFSLFKKPIENLDSLIQERRERIDRAVVGNIVEVPGTRLFIQNLKAKNMPTAVASASRVSFIELVLQSLGLREYFDAIASSDEVPRGKPEPDVFLLAAQRLGVSPDACLVIEDGAHGMVAARRAGMSSIGLVRRGELDKSVYPADFLVRSLEDVQLDPL